MLEDFYDDDYDDDPEVEDARNGHESFESYNCRFCDRSVYYTPDGLVQDATTHDTHTCYPEDARTISMEEVLGIPKEKTNMSTIKLISRTTRGISADTLNIGEYARITDTVNFGDIVLKTRNGAVNISKPAWEFPSFASPQVERLNTGDRLEITVGFTADFEDRIRTQARVNKIIAIKEVREATQWGLKESKDYVEALLK